ncbi:hypothetical protein Goshw_019001 [Gossypium schwendimanii]|uniref:Uncharacterized protein n=1 Tax=Gossypium schwendimanii TaxID=34291 RepID=A0A7J9N1U0_GOSSC|nr:hypothetical protein [Gossypium schwendimanii]
MAILQNLQEEDVPLLGIWGAVGYTPFLVLSNTIQDSLYW